MARFVHADVRLHLSDNPGAGRSGRPHLVWSFSFEWTCTMTTTTIRIRGGTMHDDCYSMELEGKEVLWNVSRMRRDAKRGRFGPPQAIAMSSFQDSPPNYDNLERVRLDWLKANPDSLSEPAIVIGAPPDSGYELLCLADGNHRVTALQEMGAEGFPAYIVPAEIEREYRMTITLEQDRA